MIDLSGLLNTTDPLALIDPAKAAGMAPGITLPPADPNRQDFLPLPTEAAMKAMQPGVQLQGLMPGEWDWMNKQNALGTITGIAKALQQPESKAPNITPPSVGGGGANLGGSTARAIMTTPVQRAQVAVPAFLGAKLWT